MAVGSIQLRSPLPPTLRRPIITAPMFGSLVTVYFSFGAASVQDVRFDWLVDHFKPKSVVPGALTVCDIAGLVKGAAAGKGLGNEFLSHIAAVDAIFHVCRGFPGEKVRLSCLAARSLTH